MGFNPSEVRFTCHLGDSSLHDILVICAVTVGFFTNSTQYKNVNIANFVIAVPLDMNETSEVCNLEI